MVNHSGTIVHVNAKVVLFVFFLLRRKIASGVRRWKSISWLSSWRRWNARRRASRRKVSSGTDSRVKSSSSSSANPRASRTSCSRSTKRFVSCRHALRLSLDSTLGYFPAERSTHREKSRSPDVVLAAVYFWQHSEGIGALNCLLATHRCVVLLKLK